MSKKVWIIVLGFLFIFNPFTKLFAADPVIGCPLGVEKGKVWLFSQTVYNSATKAFWNEDPTESPKMVNLPFDWYAKILKSSYRTEFGVTDRISMGILLTYWNKDVSKEVWKKKPSGDWIKKPVSFYSHGFGDIWTIGLIKIVKDHPIFEAIALGLGYKFDAADNSLVVHGIGTGTKDVRFALLTHDKISEKIHLCTSLWYEYRGKIRHIEIKNDSGEIVEWERSGIDIGDQFGYSIGTEYSFDKSGHYQAKLLLLGWNKLVDRDKNGEKISNTEFYDYSIGLTFIYLPLGEKYDHCKAMIGAKTPIKSVNSFSALFSPQIGLMWTF